MTDGDGKGSGGTSGVDILGKISSRITLLGAAVSGVIAFSTTVSGCVQTNENQYQHFTAAVKGEEDFWKSLYDQYIQASAKEVAEPEKTARILAIRAMASRPPEDFTAYRVGVFVDNPDLKAAEARHIAFMRTNILAATTNPASSGEETASKAQIASFFSDENDRFRARTDGAVVAESVAKTEAAATSTALTANAGGSTPISYQAQVLSAGKATGWDIDILWCPSTDTRAAAISGLVGNILAGAADGGAPIAGGVSIGRVRLRALPQALQQSDSGYYVQGLKILFDGGRGEQRAAQSVAALLNGQSPAAFEAAPTTKVTKWYLSVFVCPAPMATPFAASAKSPAPPTVPQRTKR